MTDPISLSPDAGPPRAAETPTPAARPLRARRRLVAEDLRQIAERLSPEVQAEGLNAEEAAAYCGVSRSKWYDLDAAGQCPAPVELGDSGCRRWVRSELAAWLRSGAPPRVRWNAMRHAAMQRAG